MLCAPVMGQVGALEALRSAEEDKNSMVNEYRLRRNMFVAGLNRIGLSCHVPEGAFYAFPSVKGTGLSDMEFAERLLKEQRVAVVPGQCFWRRRGRSPPVCLCGLQEGALLKPSAGWRPSSHDL